MRDVKEVLRHLKNKIEKKERDKSDNPDPSDVKTILALTPDDDLGEKKDPYYAEYERFLNAAFENASIRNIAISGGYGIGKSSIIRSFEKTREKRFLYISLIDTLKTSDNDRLEITLLRQILAVCKKSFLPKTRFHIVPEDLYHFNSKVILGAVYAFLCVCMIFSKSLSDAMHFFSIHFGGRGSHLLFLSFLLSTIYLLIRLIYTVLKFFKLKQINLKISKEALETEGSVSDSPESVLDEYRFDLIYVLEKLSKEYQAVVFEDIDRLEAEKCLSLFDQLREINISLNARNRVNSHQKKEKKDTFRFLYVINDEITAQINQTKFFDYILSVVPTLGDHDAIQTFYRIVVDDIVVDNYVADDQNSALSKEEKKMLEQAVDVSIRLKDYRTLRQIRNDYAVFFNVLTASGVKTDHCKGNLLAFVIYKVLCPYDYYLIREGKSRVFPEFIPDWMLHDADNNEEFKTVECLKDLLDYDVCKNFMGSSRSVLLAHCEHHILTDSSERIRDYIATDNDFIFGELLLSHDASTIPFLISGIEIDYVLYFIRNFQKINSDNEAKIIEALPRLDKGVMEKGILAEIKRLLSQSEDKVRIYVFTALAILKLGYRSSEDDAEKLFDWFCEGDAENGILNERLRLLEENVEHELCNDEDLKFFVENLSYDSLSDIHFISAKQTKKLERIYNMSHTELFKRTSEKEKIIT